MYVLGLARHCRGRIRRLASTPSRSPKKGHDVLRLTLAFLTLASVAVPASGQATFTPLGIPEGFIGSSASAVSADGTTVVGGSPSTLQGQGSAWRWTASGGYSLIPNLPGELVNGASGVSADGNTVVGSGNDGYVPPPGAATIVAFSWTPTSGTVNLFPSSSRALAVGVSADGTTIAGTNGAQAFRMSPADGVEYLGFLPGAWNSQAWGISADGSTVVGSCYMSNSNAEVPFQWTAATGMTAIPLAAGTALPADDTPSISTNADGTVVAFAAGPSFAGIENVIYRWSAQTGTVQITPTSVLSDYVVGGMSADGSIIVGYNSTAAGRSFLWTTSTGMLDLQSVLTRNGATGWNGWSNVFATNISADGHWIVGTGMDPSGQWEAWLAQLPTFSPGDVNLDGIVNAQDIAIMASHWLASGVGTQGDANGDGIVNAQDIGVIASHWLDRATSAGNNAHAMVPEPSAFTLLATSIIVCLFAHGTLARSGYRLEGSSRQLRKG